jgi:flagellin-like protein
MNQQDRAIIPVISTILMVAIVVILSATVSVFFSVW